MSQAINANIIYDIIRQIGVARSKQMTVLNCCHPCKRQSDCFFGAVRLILRQAHTDAPFRR